MNNKFIYQKHLGKQVESLKKWSDKKLTEYRLFEIEKYFILTAFISRKLIESCKVSDAVINMRLQLIEFGRLKVKERTLFLHSSNYDMEDRENIDLDIRNILNMIVHNNIFDVIVKEGGIPESVLLTSDKNKTKLFSISINGYINKILKIVNDDYNCSRFTVKEKENGERELAVMRFNAKE